MNDLDISKFPVSPLTSENYFTWSNEMEIILREKRLWKHVDDDEKLQISGTETKADEQKRDLALAYIHTSVDNTCEAIIRRMRCPRAAWKELKKTFQSVAEVAINAKLSQLQAVSLKKGENIVEYLS